jgi:hypothetical protein
MASSSCITYDYDPKTDLAALFIMVLYGMICFLFLVVLYIKMFVWHRLASRLKRLGVWKGVGRCNSPYRLNNYAWKINVYG